MLHRSTASASRLLLGSARRARVWTTSPLSVLRSFCTADSGFNLGQDKENDVEALNKVLNAEKVTEVPQAEELDIPMVNDNDKEYDPKLQRIADEIVKLDLIEASELIEILSVGASCSVPSMYPLVSIVLYCSTHFHRRLSHHLS